MLTAFVVDWLNETLVVEVRPKVSPTQDLERAGRITVRGLEWLIVDPPDLPRLRDYVPALAFGYDLDSRGGGFRDGLPLVPEGCFVHGFRVIERNSFVHLCARDASFEWTGDATPIG
jgi:hypothetical protein